MASNVGTLTDEISSTSAARTSLAAPGRTPERSPDRTPDRTKERRTRSHGSIAQPRIAQHDQLAPHRHPRGCGADPASDTADPSLPPNSGINASNAAAVTGPTAANAATRRHRARAALRLGSKPRSRAMAAIRVCRLSTTSATNGSAAVALGAPWRLRHAVWSHTRSRRVSTRTCSRSRVRSPGCQRAAGHDAPGRSGPTLGYRWFGFCRAC